MTHHEQSHAATQYQTSAKKWAPWWVYLVILLGANYLRVYFMQGSSLPESAVVVLALVQAALLFAIITAIWRAINMKHSG